MIDVNELTDMEHDLKYTLVNKLKEYVKEHGENFDCGDYYYNEFGIDEGDEDGVTVTKVLDFFNNGGCYFSTNSKTLADVDTYKETADEIREQLDNNFTHWAFQCLYVEVDDNHRELAKENLKYYTLYNDGVDFKDDLSEPDHGYVYNLPLEVIINIIQVIKYQNRNKDGNG